MPCVECWVFFWGWPGLALALALALGCVGECRLARLGLRLAHSGSPAVAARNSAPGVHCPVRHPALLRVVEDACAVVAADELATKGLAQLEKEFKVHFLTMIMIIQIHLKFQAQELGLSFILVKLLLEQVVLLVHNGMMII